jgi:hypothetical protein
MALDCYQLHSANAKTKPPNHWQKSVNWPAWS